MPYKVTHQSFAGKFCDSLCGVILGFILMLGGVGLIYWNESNSVCSDKAFRDAQANVQETSAGQSASNCLYNPTLSGNFVHIACGVNKTTLAVTDPGTGITASGAYQIDALSEMYQYSETSRSESKKDSVGGGTTTYTCYCWSTGWYTKHLVLNTNHFMYACSDCTVPRITNPTPICTSRGVCTSTTGLGQFSTTADGVYLGTATTGNQFKITKDQIASIDNVGTAVQPKGGTSSFSPDGSYLCSGPGACSTYFSTVGTVRISLTQLASDKISAVGMQQPSSDAQAPGRLVASTFGGSSFPPCRTRDVLYIASGDKTAAELFAALAHKLFVLTWILRVVSWLCLWIGILMITWPVSVAPDIIPCIGPLIGDLVGCMLFPFALLVGSCMFLSVTSLAYLLYHPLYAAVMLGIAAVFVAMAVVLRQRSKRQKAFERPLLMEGGGPGVVPAYQPQYAQPVQPYV